MAAHRAPVATPYGEIVPVSVPFHIGGAGSQARAAQLLSLPFMKVIYAACIGAFCYHLVAGIRHLVWDTGRGLERTQSRWSAYLVVAVSVALMLLVGYCVFVLKGRAP